MVKFNIKSGAFYYTKNITFRYFYIYEDQTVYQRKLQLKTADKTNLILIRIRFAQKGDT